MRSRYTTLQISIHWLVALLVIVAYATMELRGYAPRNLRWLVNMVHVSCGISVMVLMVARLLVRLKYPAPPIVPKPRGMVIGLSHLGHLAVYLIFIVLPVLGFLSMYYRGGNWMAFGLPMPSAAVGDEDLVETLSDYHVLIANISYCVVGIHAAAALLHHYLWKDNTLLRMMPGKRT